MKEKKRKHGGEKRRVVVENKVLRLLVLNSIISDAEAEANKIKDYLRTYVEGIPRESLPKGMHTGREILRVLIFGITLVTL